MLKFVNYLFLLQNHNFIGSLAILINELQMLDHNSIVLLLCIFLGVLILPFGSFLGGKKTMKYCIMISVIVLSFGIIYSTYSQVYEPFCIPSTLGN